MNTNQKGALAETKVMADLSSKGYRISVPIGDMPFDLICIDDNYNTYKVQVKHSVVDKNGIILVRSYYMTTYNGKLVSRYYTAKEVDVIACYVQDYDKCYYVSYAEIPKTGISLRVTPTLNNQYKGIHIADHYTEFPERG